MRVRLAVDVLAADLAEGLSVTEIAERHELPMDYVYGRIRRSGLKVNPRRLRVDWTGLAEELKEHRPREIAEARGTSVGAVYWRRIITAFGTSSHPPGASTMNRFERTWQRASPRTRSRPPTALSAGSVYRIRKLEPRRRRTQQPGYQHHNQPLEAIGKDVWLGLPP